MKIVAINSVNFGSTGNIMLGIAEKAREHGHKCYTCSAPGRGMRQGISDHVFIGTRIGYNLHLRLGYLSGFDGFFSVIDTLIFCHWLDRIHPDIIHLHNLHNCYINLPILFRYIKKRSIPTVWTLHDCWALTGQCPYFTMIECDKWKTGCHDCPQIHIYPAARKDRTAIKWKLKKKWFTGAKNMIIVTPSEWLANLAKESYLQEYPIKVIHNGINLDVFKPTESDFRGKYHLEDKIVLLGVAFGWGKRKGLDVFIELAKRLDDRYRIVLVGTDAEVEKKLPTSVIPIRRTQNQQQLAAIYSAADIFFNPTREDNFPTVNLESLACGTPVITFETGGSPESINQASGSIVTCDDLDGALREIRHICEVEYYEMDKCIERAKEFDRNKLFENYTELYEHIGLKHE